MPKDTSDLSLGKRRKKTVWFDQRGGEVTDKKLINKYKKQLILPLQKQIKIIHIATL